MMRREAVAVVALSATMFAGLSSVGHGQTTVPVAPSASAQNQQPGLPPNTAVPPTGTLPTAPGAPTGTLPTAPGVPPAAAVPPAAPGLPALPQQPTAVPGTQATTLPGLPGQPTLGTLPGVMPPATSALAVPTPPPLGSMELESAEATMETTTTAADAAAPSQLYEFLFIEDPEYGIVRQKFEAGVAKDLKEQEIQRLEIERRKGQQPGGAGADILGVTPGYAAGMGPMGMGADPMGMGADMGMAGMGGYDPTGGGALTNESAIRAAAEWDFYYDQLEMYNTYVRERLVPDSEGLPELEYNAANALQERQDLFESFQEAAIQQSNVDYNDNKIFYERLQKREDRRRAYLDWMMLKEREISDWSEVWARKVFGTRWADGEEVRIDDWYYGTDFNSVQPVIVAIDDREYVISRQPARSLQDGQLNVISSNLTPYDIIDANGYLKNPVMETLRGTVIIPPAPPVYTTSSTTGTIEIVGGVTTE